MNFSLNNDTWNTEEYDAINRVIKSNRFTMGPEVESYEKQFAEKFNSKYAIMVNSGSSANLIAIAAMVYSGKLARGSEIIVPAVSWSTTYFPLAQFDLKLKFIDINPYTLNIDVDSFEKAITTETKAIFAVNLLGNPNEFDKIIEICEKNNIILMEDNCESMCATYNDKNLGTFGIFGTFSTFYSHHMCTMEGGVVITDNQELYEYMLCLRAHGWTRSLPLDNKIYKKNADDFYEQFNFIVPGFNMRPLEMEAAIGKEQLNKLDNFLAVRRENAEYFTKKVDGFDGVRTQLEISKSSWYGFALVLEGRLENKRSEILKKLAEKNIEYRPIVAGNFTRNQAIKYLNYEVPFELKSADYIHENGLFIGNHSVDIKQLLDQLDEVFL